MYPKLAYPLDMYLKQGNKWYFFEEKKIGLRILPRYFI